MLRRHILAIAIAIVIIVVVAGALLPSAPVGRGGRGFFSPDTLATKVQSEMLVCDRVVWRSSYISFEYPLVEYNVRKRYWSQRAVSEPRWIVLFHWSYNTKGGYSQLSRELSGRGQSWIEWSERHPDMAKILWPYVLSLLRAPSASIAGYPVDSEIVAVNLLFRARNIAGIKELKDLIDEAKI